MQEIIWIIDRLVKKRIIIKGSSVRPSRAPVMNTRTNIIAKCGQKCRRDLELSSVFNFRTTYCIKRQGKNLWAMKNISARYLDYRSAKTKLSIRSCRTPIMNTWTNRKAKQRWKCRYVKDIWNYPVIIFIRHTAKMASQKSVSNEKYQCKKFGLFIAWPKQN